MIHPIKTMALASAFGLASSLTLAGAAVLAATSVPVVSGGLGAFLPPNKTVMNAAPKELARGVQQLVRAHPLSTKLEQRDLLSELKSLNSKQARAVLDALPRVVPAGEVPGLTRTLVEEWSGIDAHTIASVTPKELARQVRQAVRAYPDLVDLIVIDVFSQFTVKDGPKALAVISALVKVVPAEDMPALVRAAIEALPSGIDPDTGLSVRSALGQLIAQDASSLLPGQASAIANAVGSLTSESGGATTRAFSGFSGGFAPAFQGPAGVVNPANFSNSSGTINSPSS